jgi:hypothetical protein
MKCMCKNCEELETHLRDWVGKDKEKAKYLGLFAHFWNNDNHFVEVMKAAGFNPGQLWVDRITETLKELIEELVKDEQ